MMNKRLVSPSLHPAVIDRHFIKDRMSGEKIPDPIIQEMRDAVAAAHSVAHEMPTVRDRIMANQMETLPHREKQLADASYGLFQRGAKSIDMANSRAQAEIAQIEKAIAAPPTPRDVVSGVAGVAICSNLARMPHKRRQETIGAALADGDDTTIAAILHNPTALSGVSKTEKELLRASWQRQRFPDQVDRRERIFKAHSALMIAADALFDFWRVHSPDTSKAEASERDAQAAISNVLKNAS